MYHNRTLEEGMGTGTAATATTETLSKKDLLARVIAALDLQGAASFKSVPDIERLHPDEARAIKVEGTALEPVDATIRKNGILTDGTMGGVIDALGLDLAKAHDVFCHCIGENVTAGQLAQRLRNQFFSD